MHAAAFVPADTDTLAELQAAHLRAHAHDFADGFVAGDERVTADAPIVIDQRLVGVTDAAIFHRHFDLFFAEGAGIIAVRLERGAGGGRSPAIESCGFAVAHEAPPVRLTGQRPASLDGHGAGASQVSTTRRSSSSQYAIPNTRVVLSPRR